ncbi:MAG: metallophosphoesterase [Nocardioidaceae bacterium]
MAARTKLLLATGSVVAVVAVVIALTTGLFDRAFDGFRSLDVGAPTSTWGVDEPTASSTSAVRVAVVGDPGTGGAGEQAVAQVLADQHHESPYDALVLPGDLIYPDGEVDQIDEALLRPFEPLLGDGVELLPALGNHDYMSGESRQIMDRLDRPSDWYAQEVGSALFVVLDSNRVDDPDQTTWLRETLQQSTANWVLAVMHHPPYSAGMHGSSLDVRSAWSGLFSQYGVDLVLAGHDHDYQRSHVIDGVLYVVSGGGAKTRPTGHESFTAFSASTLHYLDLQIGPDQILGQAIDSHGHAFDDFVITGG